jgi:hypothetical protein
LVGQSRQTWAIYRLDGKAMIYLGRVFATNEDEAIKTAIEELAVTNPYHQKRLVARRAN